MKNKRRESRRRLETPSDHDAGLSPVKEKREGRGIGHEELQTALPFSERLSQTEEKFQEKFTIKGGSH